MGSSPMPPRLWLWFWIAIAFVSAVDAASVCRLTGSVQLQTYGYQDTNGADHLWLMPAADLSFYHARIPLSLHFSSGYRGDNADDFSRSGKLRLTKGYLQYNCQSQASEMRVGRFFLNHGVALGVIDGIDATHRWGKSIETTLFAGLMGPLARDFAFEKPKEALGFGGMVRFTPASFPYTQHSSFALSYIHQTRDGSVIRNRIGLNSYHKLAGGFTWLNTVHLRAQGGVLRKIISRLRYGSSSWSGMVEGGMATPDIEEYSWFNGFGEAEYFRFRFAADRWVVPAKWGFGLRGTLLIEDKTGIRLGPVVSIPWGQVGYNLALGDKSRSSGPWINLSYRPYSHIMLRASAAQTTYKWEALDIESNDLVMVNFGAEYSIPFVRDLAITAEYQLYQSPQFKQDRRAQGGLVWRFDTREGRQ